MSKLVSTPDSGIKCPVCGSVTDGRITTVEVAAPQVNGKGKAFSHGMMAIPRSMDNDLVSVPRRTLVLIRELAISIGVYPIASPDSGPGESESVDSTDSNDADTTGAQP